MLIQELLMLEVKLTNLHRNAPNTQCSSKAADNVIGIDPHKTIKSFIPKQKLIFIYIQIYLLTYINSLKMYL